jgi:teichuronic acid biosynthesis glycosyltransferase TuaG
MYEPLVSVIMPAYNAEQYITESIESVVAQTYTQWELLIVDDGSTDGTKKIIESYCKQDGRIKYFRQPNSKQGKARNLALANATGAYVAFLDADDVWLPQKLSVQLEEIINKDVDLVFSDACVFTRQLSDSTLVMQAGKGMFKGDEALKNFLEQNKIPILTVLMKTEILRSVNGFSEITSIQNVEDYHLWIRLLMHHKSLYGSGHVLAGYREHASSSTINDKLSVEKVIEAFEDLKKQYRSYRHLLSSYQKQWFKRYHYSTSDWNKNSYKKLITRNCKYLNRSVYNLFFQAVYSFFGLRITRKLITKMLNNSFVF